MDGIKSPPEAMNARRSFAPTATVSISWNSIWQPIAWLVPHILKWYRRQLLATYGPREAGQLSLIIRTLQHKPLRAGRQGRIWNLNRAGKRMKARLGLGLHRI